MSSTVAAPVAGGRESPIPLVGRRLVGAVVALFVASLVIFAGTQLLPGNAASVVLGRNGNPATVKLLNRQLHLDRPAWQQYTDWIEGLAHGDLGNSAVGIAQGASSAPIWPLISDPSRTPRFSP